MFTKHVRPFHRPLRCDWRREYGAAPGPLSPCSDCCSSVALISDSLLTWLRKKLANEPFVSDWGTTWIMSSWSMVKSTSNCCICPSHKHPRTYTHEHTHAYIHRQERRTHARTTQHHQFRQYWWQLLFQ